jgi:hypothetical protein
MSGRLILAFGHKRRRGKDTASFYAKEYLEYVSRACVHEFFAKPLKEGLGRLVLGLTEAQLYGSQKHEVDPFWDATPRHLLQQLGTEVMRQSFRDDIWCKALERKVLATTGVHFVISDMRFPNEAETIRRLGGKLIRVDRDIPSDEADFHLSETALDDWTDWDAVLDNSGSIGEMALLVQEACDRFLTELPQG